MNSEIIFLHILNVIFALGWGSFATMAVYRLAHNEPWIGRRPFCPNCMHNLCFIDYVSIISYFLHQGKCRYCKKEYSYRNIYLTTELLILIYFILNFYFNPFNEIYILNSAIIIAGVIYSVIYFTKQQSSAKMLIVIFFFACLKRVYLDNTIYNLFYGALLFGLFALLIRYIYYSFCGQSQQALDFLEFKPEDRFANKNFIPVKLALIYGSMLGLSAFDYVAIIFIIGAFVIFRKLQYALAIFMNIMIISSILN
ncbi:MAG: prepilin peptidase [Rickettsiales bacterium]